MVLPRETLQVLGREQEATVSVASMRSLVEDLHHAPSHAYALGMQCFFFHARGDVTEVQRLAGAMRSLSLAEGFTLWAPCERPLQGASAGADAVAARAWT